MKWPEPMYGDAIRGSAWVIWHDLEFKQSRTGSCAGGVINLTQPQILIKTRLLSLGLKRYLLLSAAVSVSVLSLPLLVVGDVWPSLVRAATWPTPLPSRKLCSEGCDLTLLGRWLL